MKRSAGIMVYRFRESELEIFLVHPGGPFWAKKDDGAWSVPKGEYTGDEDPLQAAKREFREETGSEINGDFILLNPRKQNSGKMVSVWAVEGDVDATRIQSNSFEIEWPPRSGKMKSFPEVDRAGWFTKEQAMKKMIPGQRGFVEDLDNLIRGNPKTQNPNPTSQNPKSQFQNSNRIRG